MWATDYEVGKHWSCFASTSALGRVRAGAHFSASEPWLFKRAPAVLITLSLGALAHTDADTHICECTAALVERGAEEDEEQHAAVGRGEVLLQGWMLVSHRLLGQASLFQQMA